MPPVAASLTLAAAGLAASTRATTSAWSARASEKSVGAGWGGWSWGRQNIFFWFFLFLWREKERSKKKKVESFQRRREREMEKKLFLPLSFRCLFFGGFLFENCAFQWRDVSDEMTEEPLRVLARQGNATLVRDAAG